MSVRAKALSWYDDGVRSPSRDLLSTDDAAGKNDKPRINLFPTRSAKTTTKTRSAALRSETLCTVHDGFVVISFQMRFARCTLQATTRARVESECVEESGATDKSTKDPFQASNKEECALEYEL